MAAGTTYPLGPCLHCEAWAWESRADMAILEERRDSELPDDTAPFLPDLVWMTRARPLTNGGPAT
jgi:hypothetical protein